MCDIFKDKKNVKTSQKLNVSLQTETLPEGEMSLQLMEGCGLPLAWHIRVTLEPSFITKSLERLMIFGGTKLKHERKKKT